MITKENVIVYQCEHCSKKLFVKNAMIKHEKNCNYNPDNWAACINCAYCQQVEKEYTDSEGINITKGFTCTKLKKNMYPFKVVKRGYLEKYPEQFEGETLMPAECAEFEFIY